MGGVAGLEGGAVQRKPQSRFQDRHDARAQLSSPPHQSLSFYVTKQRNPWSFAELVLTVQGKNTQIFSILWVRRIF